MNMYTVRSLLWLLSFWLFCGESLEKARKVEGVKQPPIAPMAHTPQIVGGTPVDASEFPWIASLYIADPNCGTGIRTNHFCGGSIFDTTTGGKSWLLTAAHCLAGISSYLDYLDYIYSDFDCHFHLYADVTRDDANDPNETNYSTIKVNGWKIHEDYNPNANATSNDVAIGWSNDQLSIDPVPLQSASPCCEPDDVVRIIGYGADYYGGNPTETLEYVDLSYVDYDTCEEMLDANAFEDNHLRPGMHCAYDPGQDSCQGDSGGPMILGTTKDSPQVGIVSWGYGCAYEGVPGIYTDVGYYYDWIIDTQTYVVITPTTTSTTEEPNSTSGLFICDDGCAIYDGYYDDGDCDCSECEDEPNWTCETCPGCPSECGYYVSCYDAFVCDDGCQIPDSYYDDGYCDCSECEDEPNWTCETCPGCPSECGNYFWCSGNYSTPTTTTTEGPLTTCIGDDSSKQKSFTYSSDEANCFPNIDSNIRDSGWTQSIGPLAVDQSVDLYTLSGAEDCQLCAARCDGRVTVTRRYDATGDWLQVVFAGNEANGIRFTKFFVWFGTSQLPLKNNGQFTVNTNAFFCKDHSPGVGSVNFLLQCRSPLADFSFEDAFHFIAHSLTTGCDPTDDGQSFCADIFD